MLHSMGNIHGCSLSLVIAFCLALIVLLSNGYSEASMYNMKGICSYKDKHYKPGETFQRGCDKCFCHDFGSYCFPPMKPTSWPKKCRRLRTECGYTVVYKENPLVECRAYSWIG
ncbi:hypothetical protein JOQ06_007521 [Pogonophryne albipinna]|uniref:Uncharacterized protein n=1 Tax=Pogonophryne albipinna TaxID=1090488 RepID=A0AAD6B189_9TELE|nr:hypothetical protein JOQ06_007521 [Pogonophryne albipinna]